MPPGPPQSNRGGLREWSAISFIAASWCARDSSAARARTCRCSMTANGGMSDRVVVLMDVMDTLVVDPFSVSMHEHFGFPTKADFLLAKRPNTWVPFEQGVLSETEFYRDFFADGRQVDVEGFHAYLRRSYVWVDGMDTLLHDMSIAGIEMHLFSNYPIWWKMVEETLAISRFAPWTFVSCKTGMRKPDPDAFVLAAKVLHCSPDQCILLDDRASNCASALEVGYRDAIQFRSAEHTRECLRKHFRTLD